MVVRVMGPGSGTPALAAPWLGTPASAGTAARRPRGTHCSSRRWHEGLERRLQPAQRPGGPRGTHCSSRRWREGLERRLQPAQRPGGPRGTHCSSRRWREGLERRLQPGPRGTHCSSRRWREGPEAQRPRGGRIALRVGGAKAWNAGFSRHSGPEGRGGRIALRVGGRRLGTPATLFAGRRLQPGAAGDATLFASVARRLGTPASAGTAARTWPLAFRVGEGTWLRSLRSLRRAPHRSESTAPDTTQGAQKFVSLDASGGTALRDFAVRLRAGGAG